VDCEWGIFCLFGTKELDHEQVSQPDQEQQGRDRHRIRPDRRSHRRCGDWRHAGHRHQAGHDLQQRFEQALSFFIRVLSSGGGVERLRRFYFESLRSVARLEANRKRLNRSDRFARFIVRRSHGERLGGLFTGNLDKFGKMALRVG